ncbi:hypothetical protein BCR44DRAFT_267632 [Catenaria anguillulae PL171]|uniref:Uncharacterized protein n=1 Tax=Catenaria anguillulae PL171 TaxID=765915 RepID=A0A1Y2H582_9FUNG|nr:hypothetical protein BCR44DRAFT_267632 [Catenaria anguillulae PL171]
MSVVSFCLFPSRLFLFCCCFLWLWPCSKPFLHRILFFPSFQSTPAPPSPPPHLVSIVTPVLLCIYTCLYSPPTQPDHRGTCPTQRVLFIFF